jgi:hypothetical protein
VASPYARQNGRVPLRNIFDQYSQPENRITHALMTAINEDRELLGLFLHELIKVKPPVNPRNLSVLEQQYPREKEPSEEELERRGIPDGWIFDKDGWCVFIETKVIAKFNVDQINRHRRTAERRGFQSITAVAIAPLFPESLPPGTVQLEWRTVFAWLPATERSQHMGSSHGGLLGNGRSTFDRSQTIEGGNFDDVFRISFHLRSPLQLP